MDLKELLDLHEVIESRINAYWTYWSVAIIAVAGWLFSNETPLPKQPLLQIAIAIGVFFLANLVVLWNATSLVTGFRDEIRLKASHTNFESPKLAQALKNDPLVFRLPLTLALHLIIDVIVLLAIFCACS